jgi:hypothetical protein
LNALLIIYVNIQSCLEGIGGIDTHIGGDELHRECYRALQKSWLEWSGGYAVPIERTTLRGTKVHAPIAGMALRGPAPQRDAIWHFFFKTRGRATEPTFKAEQIELAIVLEPEDFIRAEQSRERLNDPDGGDSTIPTKVRSWFCSFSLVCKYCSLQIQ